jgi:hypothetical protein
MSNGITPDIDRRTTRAFQQERDRLRRIARATALVVLLFDRQEFLEQLAEWN